jgi:Outer membrane lipoprotein-sorting protein
MKAKSERFPVAVFILCCCLFLLGWADSLEQIQAEAEKIQSIKAEFVQTKRMPILSKPLVSTGAFYFLAPESVRWEYASPVQSILLMHGGEIKKFIKGEKGWTKDASANLQSMRSCDAGNICLDTRTFRQ